MNWLLLLRKTGGCRVPPLATGTAPRTS